MPPRKSVSTDDHYVGLPRRLKIGGFSYRVRYLTAAEAATCFGMCFQDDKVIAVCKSLSPGQLANTFIHEVLHALHNLFQLDDGEEEENVTTRTASGLCMFFVDNKAAGVWWHGLLTKEHQE